VETKENPADIATTKRKICQRFDGVSLV
jgi:hypothetical protein